MFGFNSMTPIQAAPDKSADRAAKPKTTPAADMDSVLFDQLDRLIIDKASRGCWHYCECVLCTRYWTVHNALMGCFPNLQRTEKPTQEKALEKTKSAA